MPAQKPLQALKAAIKPHYLRALALLPGPLYIMIEFLRSQHRLPDLNDPRSFNEKIVWRMLYEQDPRVPELVDKVRAKEVIAEKYGENLIIPTLATYRSAEELDFTQPPLNTPPYVIKANHGSGMNLFVRDRNFDPQAIKRKLAEYLATDYGALTKEWAYTRVPRRLLVEPLIQSLEKDLCDYKFHVFSGRVFAIENILDRFGDHVENMHDRDWNFLDFSLGSHPREDRNLPPPPRFREMLELAEAIGKEFSYVRVDLYSVDGEIKFGELTFYPGAGRDKFHPAIWDLKFGREWRQVRG